VIVQRAVFSLGLALVAAMCGHTPAPAQNALPTAASRVTGAPALPPALAAPPRSYDRKGRRDPFQPLEAGPGTDLAVASARLKGIIRGSSPRALVETPDGIGYILRLGDALGEGRLIEIGADRVVFSVPPGRGSPSEHIVLRLPGD
jgi:hypothetical protein